MVVVLDASALVALLLGEPGSEVVAAACADACLSTINLAEVLERLARDGMAPVETHKRLAGLALDYVAVTEQHAVKGSELRRATRQHGLSTADCICLALALERSAPVLTSDRIWRDVDVGVEVRLIR